MGSGTILFGPPFLVSEVGARRQAETVSVVGENAIRNETTDG